MPRPTRLLPVLALAAAVAVALPLALTASGSHPANAAQTRLTAATPDADSPAGFYYGTDSWPIAITSSPPYREPVLSSRPVYGGYIGMAGNWARWSGCGGNIAWSSADSAAANTNYTRTARASAPASTGSWAARALTPTTTGPPPRLRLGRRAGGQDAEAMGKPKVTYPIVWLDIELPGSIKPALDNGWNNVYTSPCSGKISTSRIAAAVDRAEVNGYEAYLTAHSSYLAGVYSSPSIWSLIFGPGSASNIPAPTSGRTPDATSKLAKPPGRWCDL